MPIEIKELHIKVTVNQEPKSNKAPGAPSIAGSASSEALIAECVEQVMQIMKTKIER